MNVATLGIDIGKTWFHIVGMDERGKPLFQKKLRRPKLMRFIAISQPCSIGMEACSGSQHLARRFIQFGHDVKLIAPRFVKAYLTTGADMDWIASWPTISGCPSWFSRASFLVTMKDMRSITVRLLFGAMSETS